MMTLMQHIGNNRLHINYDLRFASNRGLIARIE